MAWDTATIAHIATILSLLMAIISIIISVKTKKDFDRFTMIEKSININSGGGNIEIAGNVVNIPQEKEEKIKK